MGDYGVDPLGQPELGFDNNSGAEWIQPVPSEDETDADVCVYMLCIKFNYTGDNVTWYASDNAHPFSYFSDWGGTTQGGGGDAAYYGSTKGGPLERSSYYVGGSTNKANHWVATSTARFTEKPITWGFLDQYQGGGNGDQGSSMSRFQFDTKIGIDTESNSGEEPTFGAGIGWAKKGSTYDGGFPESYMFTAPNLYAAITVGQLTSISTEYNQTSFPNQTIRDGAGTRVVNTIVSSFESVVNAQLAVSYDDRGVIESIELQDDGAGSSSFKYGQPIFVQFQVNVEPSGSAAIRAELYAAGIDGNDAFAQGERTKISRGMTFNNDGSILFDVQPTGYPYSLAFVPNMLIALSASDGSGNGSDGGGGGDLGGNISAIYYGSTPVSTVYYGSTSIAAINLGAS